MKAYIVREKVEKTTLENYTINKKPVGVTSARRAENILTMNQYNQKLIIAERLFALRKERQKWTFQEQELSQQIEREALQIALDELNKLEDLSFSGNANEKIRERAKDSRIQELAKRNVIWKRRESEKKARNIEKLINKLSSNNLSDEQRIEIETIFKKNPPPKEFYSPLTRLSFQTFQTSIQPVLQESQSPSLPEAQPAVDLSSQPRPPHVLSSQPAAPHVLSPNPQRMSAKDVIIRHADEIRAAEKNGFEGHKTRWFNNLAKRLDYVNLHNNRFNGNTLKKGWDKFKNPNGKSSAKSHSKSAKSHSKK